jgi:hypothetical protein
MTRPEDRFVRKNKEFFTQGSGQFPPGRARQIDPADTPNKESIPGKQVTLSKEANASRRMPRRVQDTQTAVSKTQEVTILYASIRLGRRSPAHQPSEEAVPEAPD